MYDNQLSSSKIDIIDYHWQMLGIYAILDYYLVKYILSIIDVCKNDKLSDIISCLCKKMIFEEKIRGKKIQQQKE